MCFQCHEYQKHTDKNHQASIWIDKNGPAWSTESIKVYCRNRKHGGEVVRQPNNQCNNQGDSHQWRLASICTTHLENKESLLTFIGFAHDEWRCWRKCVQHNDRKIRTHAWGARMKSNRDAPGTLRYIPQFIVAQWAEAIFHWVKKWVGKYMGNPVVGWGTSAEDHDITSLFKGTRRPECAQMIQELHVTHMFVSIFLCIQYARVEREEPAAPLPESTTQNENQVEMKWKPPRQEWILQ